MKHRYTFLCFLYFDYTFRIEQLNGHIITELQFSYQLGYSQDGGIIGFIIIIIITIIGPLP